MTVTPINSYEEFQSIINSGRIVIVDFWATWCGPCRAISPVLETLSNVPGNTSIGFYKVDVDALPDVSQEVGVRAMPTFIVFKDGSKAGDLVGANPQGLQQLVTSAVSLV